MDTILLRLLKLKKYIFPINAHVQLKKNLTNTEISLPIKKIMLKK